MTAAALIDVVGFLVATACAFLLLTTARRGGSPIVLWTGVCFGWLATNSLLAVIDSQTTVDLELARGATGAVGVSVLLIALLLSPR